MKTPQQVIEELQARFDALPEKQKYLAVGLVGDCVTGGAIEANTADLRALDKSAPFYELKDAIEELPETEQAWETGEPAPIHKLLWRAWSQAI